MNGIGRSVTIIFSRAIQNYPSKLEDCNQESIPYIFFSLGNMQIKIIVTIIRWFSG